MENAINTLRIQNFKSIKDVTMQPRRVNLIIGQPNVGKSNILEAMSLLGGIVYEHSEKFMESFIRFEEPRQIFYDNIIANSIKVVTDKEECRLSYRGNKFSFILKKIPKPIIRKAKFYGGGDLKIDENENEQVTFRAGALLRKNQLINLNDPKEGDVYTEFDNNGKYGIDGGLKTYNAPKKYPNSVSIRPYIFSKNVYIKSEYDYFYLHPPYGSNLINVIQSFPKLRSEISHMFEPYGLKMLIRIDERRLEVIKDLEGIIYSYPYSSIADTLQRIIFYLAAIESNDDAVILLEEPEAHSYPVYVSMLGRRMVESRNNQFFVATHSPYLITEVLEQMLPDEQQAQELAIFVAYYEDYQTKVKQLSDEEVRAIRNDGLDVFYNMDRYIPRPVNG